MSKRTLVTQLRRTEKSYKNALAAYERDRSAWPLVLKALDAMWTAQANLDRYEIYMEVSK
jgi:hypothetical protein